MAKVTGGLLSLGARGTIGKTMTFAGWRGQPYVRQTVTPANPKTVDQEITRTLFKNGHSIYKLGAGAFTDAWFQFAKGQKFTGWNAFIGRFTSENRGQADLSQMTFSPGNKGGLAALTLVLTPAALQITADITEPALPTGWVIDQAFATAIEDQDPDTMTVFETKTVGDAVAPYSIVLTGLKAATAYRVGAYIRYTKPDGSVAYGPSISDVATTP